VTDLEIAAAILALGESYSLPEPARGSGVALRIKIDERWGV
jgi:hypothetical protein